MVLVTCCRVKLRKFDPGSPCKRCWPDSVPIIKAREVGTPHFGARENGIRQHRSCEGHIVKFLAGEVCCGEVATCQVGSAQVTRLVAGGGSELRECDPG